MAKDTKPQANAEEAFTDDARGWQKRWQKEFNAAKDEHRDWQEKGKAIVDRFLDKRNGSNLPRHVTSRLNLFTSSVQTKRAMLYGKTPTVDVRPRFADAQDSTARLAGEIAERALNNDVESPRDGYVEALGLALLDRLLPGIAFARLRYVAQMEKVPAKPAMQKEGRELAPEVPEYDKKSSEEVETDYIHWEDVLWSPCRTFREMRWCAFRTYLTREEGEARFGKLGGKRLPLNAKKDNSGASDSNRNNPWGRTEVWEIWDKENECVWFWVEGWTEVLKPVDLDDAQFNSNGSLRDPLGLDNFWPFPKPFMANVTTSAFQPRADYTLVQDLYEELDRVSSAIGGLIKAVGAKGIYDKTSAALAGLLTEDTANKMIPVEGWRALQEKGGLKAAFELMPLDGLVAALDKLREYRQELKAQIFEITGDSDLSRGQQLENGTPGEAQVKAKFASIRMQALQDEFARFASDLQALRLEIMCKHFEPQSIVDRSNILHSYDASPDDPQAMAKIQAAVELLKSDVSCYRIEVKPESVSMSDFAELQAEGTQVVGALSQFFQAAAPVAQMMPGSTPDLLKILQWLMSRYRGASSISGVLEQAIQRAEAQMQQQAANPQPQQQDPKLATVQAKNQGDLAKIQAQAQSEMVRQEHETQQLALREQNAAQTNVQEELAKARIRHGQQVAAALIPQPTPGGTPV